MSLVILAFQLTVELPEIIISLLVALVLGFSINFFWNSRKSIQIDQVAEAEGISENDNWKLKYYNDMDMQERAQQQLRERLAEIRENEQIMNIEVDELRKELKALEKTSKDQPVQETVAPEKQPVGSSDYLAQLTTAQQNMLEHNHTIQKLVEQIEQLKDSEDKYESLSKENEDLNLQLTDAKKLLTEKDNEVGQLRQRHRLAEEMNDRLNKAYLEFNVLQEKLQKLEGNLSQPQKGADYEQLHESYFKLTKDFDEARQRQIALWDENQRLSRILSDTEDKLREANFQRQQLQKKVAFLEELNNDLQQVSEHHKKLDSQLRRISEMDALLTKATQQPKADRHTDEEK